MERCIDGDYTCGKYISEMSLIWFKITGSELVELEVIGIEVDLVRINRNLPGYDQDQLEFTGIKPEMAGIGLNQSVNNPVIILST